MDIRAKTAVVVLALIGCSLAGCGGSSSDEGMPDRAVQGLVSTPQEKLELKEPQSCGAFNQFVANAVTGSFVNGGLVRCRDCLNTWSVPKALIEGTWRDR